MDNQNPSGGLLSRVAIGAALLGGTFFIPHLILLKFMPKNLMELWRLKSLMKGLGAI